jgi:hypothetical protein
MTDELLNHVVVNTSLLKQLAGIECKAAELKKLCSELEVDKMTIGVARRRYPVINDKIHEIRKSVERGEMQKRILSDPDCILAKKPVGWASFTSCFIEELEPIVEALTARHEALKKQNYIITKQGKLVYA